MGILQRIRRAFRPNAPADTSLAFALSADTIPTLWLLGKTGAGKSSLVKALTQDPAIALGQGFKPCTQTASRYLFPTNTPIVAFLDTRGLAEAGYDARDDIEACAGSSHALILMLRADDPEQSQVLSALRQIRKSGRIRNGLLVHTAIGQVPDAGERARCIQHNLRQVQDIWGPIDHIAIELSSEQGQPEGLEALVDKLGELLPIVSAVFARHEHDNAEELRFQERKREILWYAGAAGACDAIPVLGLVAVPGIQTKMLHGLARHYGITWNRRLLAEFGSALGLGFGVQYVSRLGLQQLAKMIPLYGQTVGAASAAVASYAFTYALGRVACMYLYRKTRGETAAPEELKARFRQAFDDIKPVARDETANQR